jgi:UrcA family protein
MLFLAGPALAQDYGPPPDDSAYPQQPPGYVVGPSEEVTVTAPRLRFREEGSGRRSMDLPPEKASLSKVVSFHDLDLTTWDGADRLRGRVERAAYRVCAQLRDAYPFEQLSTGTRCYRDAVQNGMVRANEAISTARLNTFYDYGYED